MREMTVREANQNFSQLIAAAEAGETIVITKNGKAVARLSPQPADKRSDPEFQAAYADLKASLEAKKPLGRPFKPMTRDEIYDRSAPVTDVESEKAVAAE